MDNIKNIVIGTIVTIIIGGTAYSVNQADIVKNFADDTGLTKEQAEQYIKEIPEEELVAWGELGSYTINNGQELLKMAKEIDCINYEYEWELLTSSCAEGKSQITKLARDWISLGQSYIKLNSDSASESDIRETIQLIDQVNSDFQFEIISGALDQPTIDEERRANSYNKATLKAVLDSYYKDN